MQETKGKSDWREELHQAAQQLRDPFRMRLAVALVMILTMLFAISEPLHGKSKRSRRELQQLRDKVRTAEEVQLLTEALNDIDSRIVQGQGNDAITGLLIELLRTADAELLQINVETPQRLGPIYNVRATLDLTGEFSELTHALHAIESQNQLCRVESLQIRPADRGAELPVMQLSVRLLKEKE